MKIPVSTSAEILLRVRMPPLPVLGLLVPSVAMALHFTPYGHNNQRLVQMALLGLALVYLILKKSVTAWPRNRAAGVALILFFMLGVFSTSFAHAPIYAMLEVGTLFLLFVIALTIGGELSKDYHRIVAWVLAIVLMGCGAYLLQASLGYSLSLASGQVPHVADLIAIFGNYRSFNYAQTITLPLLVWLCCIPSRRAIQVAAWSITVGWWALLLASGGRGALLGVAAGIVIVLLTRRSHGWRFCATMGTTAALGYVINKAVFIFLPLSLGLQPFGLMSGMASRSAQDPTSSRTVLWERSLDMIAADPILGAGPMHFAHYGIDLGIASSPHSWLFQFGGEWGLPALACLCVAIFAGFKSLLQCAATLDADDKPDQLVATALLATGTAIVVDGLVSGLLVMTVSQLLITAYLGCAIGWARSRSAPQAATSVEVMAMRGAMLIAGVAVAVAVLIDLPDVLQKQGTGSPQADDIYYPRFWLNGKF